MNRIRRQDGQPHICIVGAGMSGLRSAELLISAGFKVTILEARDRIGGRVSTYINEATKSLPNHPPADPPN